MATFGPYTFDAANDADFDDFTFESAVLGTAAINDAPANGQINQAWNWENEQTASGGVGPTSGQGGDPDGYVYTEASGAADFNKWFLTFNQPLDADDPLTVEYFYGARGNSTAAIIELQTQTENGPWVTRQTIDTSLTADASGTDPSTWNQENVDIGALVSGPTMVRWLITIPSGAANDFHNDIGFDSITIVGTALDMPAERWVRLAKAGGRFRLPAGASPHLTLAISDESGGGVATVQYGGQTLTEQVEATTGGGFASTSAFFTLTAAGVALATDDLVTATFNTPGSEDDVSIWARWDFDVESVNDTGSTTTGANITSNVAVDATEDGVTFALVTIGAQNVTVNWTGTVLRDEFTGSQGQASASLADVDSTADETVTAGITANTGGPNRSAVAVMSLNRAPAVTGATAAVTLASAETGATAAGNVDPGASAGATASAQVAGVNAAGTVTSGATAGSTLASSQVVSQVSGNVDPGGTASAAVASQNAGVTAVGSVSAGATSAATVTSNQAGALPAGSIDPGAAGSVAAGSAQAGVTAAGLVGSAVIGAAAIGSAVAALVAAGAVDPGVSGSTTVASQQAGVSVSGLAGSSVIGSTSLPGQQGGVTAAGTVEASVNGTLLSLSAEAQVSAAGALDQGADAVAALPSDQAGVQSSGLVDAGASSSTSLPSQLAEVSISGLVPLGPLGSAGGLVTNPAAVTTTGSVLNPILGAASLGSDAAGILSAGNVLNPILGAASLQCQIAGAAFAGNLDQGVFDGLSLAGQVGGVVVSGRFLEPGAANVRYFSEIIAQVRENVIFGSLDDGDREFERMTLKAEVHNLERTRGETFDFLLRLPDTASGSTFIMVANKQRDPANGDDNIFQINGVIDAVDSTEVTFTPVLADVDIAPGVYYFSIWQTTPLGAVRVSADGSLKINQGIPV